MAEHAEMTATDARRSWKELVGRAQHGHQRTIITQHGKAAAAVISAEELEYFERLEDMIDARAARRALADVRRNGAVDGDDLLKELDI